MGLEKDTDEDFLGYVSLHCETERALFANAHVRRLCELAGREAPQDLSENGLTAVPRNVAMPLVAEARRRLRKEENRRSPHALPEGDEFVVLSEGVMVFNREGEGRELSEQERLLFRLAQLVAEYGTTGVRSKLDYLASLEVTEGSANALGVPLWSSGRRLRPW